MDLIESKDMFSIEEKWQKRWEEDHLFEANPDGRRKFMATYPYSYMNGLPHIGHGFTSLRVDFISRYKRMRGYNALFPFAFHCTGLPIVASATRIREGEEKQLSIMKDMGIGEAEIMRFADPIYWTDYFPRRWEQTMRRLGMSIDWRRKFITTSLNKSYDSFVSWQFNRLKDGDFVRKGSHPVIWCPKDGIPVGDHDRRSGEGETPTEYTLIKFRLDDGLILVAATLRPETAYGQTNLWVNPETRYIIAGNGSERWVLSSEAAMKLAEQGVQLHEEGTLDGGSIVGRKAYSFTMKTEIPVLPALFADPGKGTGIVSSVPSDSPDDYVALMELKRGAKEGSIKGAAAQAVEGISPIEIIETPGYGRLPARKVVERLGIRSQSESAKLESAREEIYREGFYKGVMVSSLPEIGGMPVEAARVKIKERMLKEGIAALMYEPSGEVICRCLTRCIVKIVDNQWFLAYGDPEWKKLAHEAVAGMNFYPAFLNRQFDNVIDWLKDWACVHHTGLGSALPWDQKWKIESLSDSTLYMAYYTIAHRLKSTADGMAQDISFYDYVFLGRGSAKEAGRKSGIDPAKVEEMRREFLYWYPLDLRVSGKDLIGNHLTFAIFNHTAIFSRELWPKAFAVNGWITISGSKMSKSAGNSMMLDTALERYGADVTRLTSAYAGEGFDDPNWDDDFAESALKRLYQMQEAASSASGEGMEEDDVDRWLLSTAASIYGRYTDNMEQLLFKSAVKLALIDMQNALKWYARRKRGKVNASALRPFIRLQVMMMAPFTPHICEEIWHSMGNAGYVCASELPEPGEMQVDAPALLREEYLESVMGDIDEIVKVTGIKPSSIYIYTAAEWQKQLLENETGSGDPAARKRIMSAAKGKAAERFFKKYAMEKGQGRLEFRRLISSSFDEREFLASTREFLEGELGASVVIQMADDSDIEDPAGRSGNAFPGRPAIFVK